MVICSESDTEPFYRIPDLSSPPKKIALRIVSDKLVNIISNPDAAKVETVTSDIISDTKSDTIVSLEEVEQAIKTEPSEITIETSPPSLTKAEISELKSQFQNIEIEDSPIDE